MPARPDHHRQSWLTKSCFAERFACRGLSSYKGATRRPIETVGTHWRREHRPQPATAVCGWTWFRPGMMSAGHDVGRALYRLRPRTLEFQAMSQSSSRPTSRTGGGVSAVCAAVCTAIPASPIGIAAEPDSTARIDATVLYPLRGRRPVASGRRGLLPASVLSRRRPAVARRSRPGSGRTPDLATISQAMARLISTSLRPAPPGYRSGAIAAAAARALRGFAPAHRLADGPAGRRAELSVHDQAYVDRCDPR